MASLGRETGKKDGARDRSCRIGVLNPIMEKGEARFDAESEEDKPCCGALEGHGVKRKPSHFLPIEDSARKKEKP